MIDLSIFSRQEFEFCDRHGYLVEGMSGVCVVMMQVALQCCRRCSCVRLWCSRVIVTKGAEGRLARGAQVRKVVMSTLRPRHLTACPTVFEDGKVLLGMPKFTTEALDSRQDQAISPTTPSNNTHMHFLDISNGGGACVYRYDRPQLTQLTLEPARIANQALEATSSGVTGLQRNARLSYSVVPDRSLRHHNTFLPPPQAKNTPS